MFKRQSALFAAAVLIVPAFFSILLFQTFAVGHGRFSSCPNDSPELSWDNCQGTKTFLNGSKYVGEFKNDKPNGQGTYTFPNRNKYVGEIKDDRYNGQGTFTFANGNKYVGEFKDGKFNGQGTFASARGNKYVGEWKDGKFNGQGTLTYANGNRYVGEFKDGEFTGKGTVYAAKGAMTSSGPLADGKFVGTVADQETIRMEINSGVYVVPVRFNDTITLDAVVDSGATDVSIPADVVLTLMRTNTISQQDFLGQQTYVLADGSKVPSQQFRIRSLKVGNKTIENVVASIASVNATILLGQSFLRKFKSWSVDNEQHVLILR